MRNCLLTLDYTPNRGGVARYLEALVLTFPTRFTVLSSVAGNPNVDEVELLSKDRWPKWRVAFELVERRRHDFDKVWVSHLHPLGLVAWLAKKRFGLPYVVILHGLDFRLGLRNPWKRMLSKKILRGADTVVCNTEALAEDVRSFDQKLNPIVVHPSLPILSRSGQNLEVSRRIVRVLTVARLVSRKNHYAVLKALVGLHDLEYLIVGNGPDRDYLEKQTSELGLGDLVHFYGDVSDEELSQIYADSDIFILPILPDQIDVEGFGIVYLEAAAAGLPIVATKMRGVEEALCSEGSIQLDEPTPDAIANALQTLATDPDRRKAMGEVNRAFVQRFSREEQFGKLEPYV